jgi:hypothetical protein
MQYKILAQKQKKKINWHPFQKKTPAQKYIIHKTTHSDKSTSLSLPVLPSHTSPRVQKSATQEKTRADSPTSLPALRPFTHETDCILRTRQRKKPHDPHTKEDDTQPAELTRLPALPRQSPSPPRPSKKNKQVSFSPSSEVYDTTYVYSSVDKPSRSDKMEIRPALNPERTTPHLFRELLLRASFEQILNHIHQTYLQTPDSARSLVLAVENKLYSEAADLQLPTLSKHSSIQRHINTLVSSLSKAKEDLRTIDYEMIQERIELSTLYETESQIEASISRKKLRLEKSKDKSIQQDLKQAINRLELMLFQLREKIVRLECSLKYLTNSAYENSLDINNYIESRNCLAKLQKLITFKAQHNISYLPTIDGLT